jgi:hypothetical protein
MGTPPLLSMDVLLNQSSADAPCYKRKKEQKEKVGATQLDGIHAPTKIVPLYGLSH